MREPQWLLSTNSLGGQSEPSDEGLVMPKYGSVIRSLNTDDLVSCLALRLAHFLVEL